MVVVVIGEMLYVEINGDILYLDSVSYSCIYL